jgi:hypothetical protein
MQSELPSEIFTEIVSKSKAVPLHAMEAFGGEKL